MCVYVCTCWQCEGGGSCGCCQLPRLRWLRLVSCSQAGGCGWEGVYDSAYGGAQVGAEDRGEHWGEGAGMDGSRSANHPETSQIETLQKQWRVGMPRIVTARVDAGRRASVDANVRLLMCAGAPT